jgi:hypothetical protein
MAPVACVSYHDCRLLRAIACADKLAATKEHDREIKEALKVKREQEKQYKEEVRCSCNP